jgi:hypothetical protein
LTLSGAAARSAAEDSLALRTFLLFKSTEGSFSAPFSGSIVLSRCGCLPRGDGWNGERQLLINGRLSMQRVTQVS